MTIVDLIPLSNRLAELVGSPEPDWLEVHKQAELIRKLAAEVSKHAAKLAEVVPRSTLN